MKRPDRKFVIAATALLFAAAAVGPKPAPARHDGPVMAEANYGERVMLVLKKLFGAGER